jgi:hypothetical protein
MRNRDFKAINERLFGNDDPAITQMDWIDLKSRHQVYLVDSAQSVRPGDLQEADLRSLVSDASAQSRLYRLISQMRVGAGRDFVAYVRAVLNQEQVEATLFHRLRPPFLRRFDRHAG